MSENRSVWAMGHATFAGVIIGGIFQALAGLVGIGISSGNVLTRTVGVVER